VVARAAAIAAADGVDDEMDMLNDSNAKSTSIDRPVENIVNCNDPPTEPRRPRAYFMNMHHIK
jgi:hypothetical protein